MQENTYDSLSGAVLNPVFVDEAAHSSGDKKEQVSIIYNEGIFQEFYIHAAMHISKGF